MCSGDMSLLLDFQYWNSRVFNWMGLRNFVIAPLSEELIFRACITFHLRPLFSSCILLCFVSSLFFSLAHLHHIFESVRHGQDFQSAFKSSLFQVFYTTLFGMYSGFLMLRTGNIASSVVTHSLCNFFGLPDITGAIERAKYHWGLCGQVLLHAQIVILKIMKLGDALKGNVTYETIRPYVISCLPDDSLASESCIADLEFASNYLDCTYFTLRVLNTELLQIKQASKIKSNSYYRNVLTIFDLLLKPEKKPSGFLGDLPKPKSDLARNSNCSHLRHYFTQVWLSFLSNELSDDVRIQAIRFLGDGRMNRLAEIRLLSNYILPIFDPDPENKLSSSEVINFSTSWSRAVSHTVLGLIHKGDVNYPRLYIRLYRLLDETLFECPDARPFLIDLDIYLSSMHLATSVVASFIKRLSQLCIFSPLSLLPAMLLIILNCLERHPQCRILIDCKKKPPRKSFLQSPMINPHKLQLMYSRLVIRITGKQKLLNCLEH
ncbi:unnamed protein product [Heterobilharzia americana]|nr:unnamed protein product [Heterobilharzia americana]